MSNDNITQRLFQPNQSMLKDLGVRVFLVICIITFAVCTLWFLRDGLYDTHDVDINFLDVVYFTILTITTVGFGDIVPVSTESRAFIAFFITPLRLIVWLIFVSTAYQLILRERWEMWRIFQLRKKLKNHTIICGFGVSGRTAAEELITRGVAPSEIVAIDPNRDSLSHAVALGVSAIRGDATKEKNLIDAGITNAKNAIISVNNDETATLTALTIKDLNPKINLVATCRESENIRLIYRSGAESVIASSAAVGKLSAAAINCPVSAAFIDDIISYGRGLDLIDRTITKEEAGRRLSELKDIHNDIVLGIKINGKRINFRKLQDYQVNEGDVVVLLTTSD